MNNTEKLLFEAIEQIEAETGVGAHTNTIAERTGINPIAIKKMLAKFEESGDVIRVGMGHQYKSLRPEVRR